MSVVSTLLPPAETSAAIPKILHQTFSRACLAVEIERNVRALQAANPGWDYRFYDDTGVEHFIRAEYGEEILALYRRIDPIYGAARADLFRYLAVYRFGGIYLDIKSRFVRPIDESIAGDESYVISQWSNDPGERYEGFGLKPELAAIPGGEFQQWHVIAAPRHPFLRAVLIAVFEAIETYRPWRGKTGKPGVMRLTGPVIYTLTIAPLLAKYPHKFVRNESALALDYSILPGSAHTAVLGRHYALSGAPIVRPKGGWWLAGTAYQLASAARRGIRQR